MSYKWKYHSQDNKGRGLALLSLSEVALFWEAFDTVCPNGVPRKDMSNLFESRDVDNELKQLIRLRGFGESLSLSELASLNYALNGLFSDQGWRAIRQKLNRRAANIRRAETEIADLHDSTLEVKTAWDYEGSMPSRGKRLSLLTKAEISVCVPILKDFLDNPLSDVSRFRGLYITDLSKMDLARRCRALNRELDRVLRQVNSGKGFSNVELGALNESLNHFFSDSGWRLLRTKQAQKKRRVHKSLIELSTKTVENLTKLKIENSFENFDESIDFLLQEQKINPELEKLHAAMQKRGVSTYGELIELILK